MLKIIYKLCSGRAQKSRVVTEAERRLVWVAGGREGTAFMSMAQA